MSFRLLIIDDSMIIRAMLIKTLKASGVPILETLQAANGQEALNVLASTTVDLIFVDINMPVMDGVEFIEQVKQNPVLNEIPVVVVSTEGSNTKIEKILNRGVRAFIRKPFTPEMIRNTIKDQLGDWGEGEGDDSGFEQDSF